MPGTLIDAGPIIAYYDAGDNWHKLVKVFLENFTGQLVTTSACITEVMYMLRADHRVQNELLLDLSRGLYHVEPLLISDFSRIAELNTKYHNMPADFTDLSLLAISERLNILEIASLDSDFNIYRRQDKKMLKRIFPSLDTSSFRRFT